MEIGTYGSNIQDEMVLVLIVYEYKVNIKEGKECLEHPSNVFQAEMWATKCALTVKGH